MRLPVLLVTTLLAATGGCATAPATDQGVEGAAERPFNVLGREDAPVTIIEFTDLQCPYCALFAIEVFPQLRRNYIDAGRVRFASRDLPLPMHPFAVTAAVAARCAGEQGRFWEFREALFAAQASLGPGTYVELARKHGLDLDLEAFAACRSDGRQAANVRADLDLAHANGITATPSLIIGRLVDGQFQGETIEGAKSYAVIAAKIDALLDATR